jgi:hypothetical protein
LENRDAPCRQKGYQCRLIILALGMVNVVSSFVLFRGTTYKRTTTEVQF